MAKRAEKRCAWCGGRQCGHGYKGATRRTIIARSVGMPRDRILSRHNGMTLSTGGGAKLLS